MKTVDQYVKKEDETYQRVMIALSDAEKSRVSQEIVTVERQIQKNTTLSYITYDYAKTAIEVEMAAEKELEKVIKPRDWREEYADYKKLHPEMDVEEMIDSFDDYYNGLWDKYNAQNVKQEIRTRGR